MRLGVECVKNVGSKEVYQSRRVSAVALTYLSCTSDRFGTHRDSSQAFRTIPVSLNSAGVDNDAAVTVTHAADAAAAANAATAAAAVAAMAAAAASAAAAVAVADRDGEADLPRIEAVAAANPPLKANAALLLLSTTVCQFSIFCFVTAAEAALDTTDD